MLPAIPKDPTSRICLFVLLGSLPALPIYLWESIRFFSFCPIAWIAAYRLAVRDLGPFGFAESSARRQLGSQLLLFASALTFLAPLLGSDKVGYLAIVVAVLAFGIIVRGFAPVTRVASIGLLLLITCESPMGLHRKVHALLGETSFAFASSIMDTARVFHSFSDRGLETEIMSIDANWLVPTFDNVWIAVVCAVLFSAHNRRPLLVGFLNLAFAPVVYVTVTSIYIASIGFLAGFTSIPALYSGWLLVAGSLMKIGLQVAISREVDRGFARLSLPVPITCEEHTKGLFRIYAALAIWPAALTPQRDQNGQPLIRQLVGHEHLIDGCHTPVPPHDLVQASSDPFKNSKLLPIIHVLCSSAFICWIARLLVPSIFPDLPV